ncbi:MAG: methanol utilization protein MoxY [Methylococcaceae bacterium]|nr:methanol utilization protein MoxY [Methylococcaceae bacterium]
MIALTMLIIIGTGTLFVIHNARRSVVEEVRSSVNMALQLIDAGLVRTSENEAALLSWLHELSLLEKTRHLHIQVQQPPEKIIQLAAPPGPAETTAAPGWFVWAVTPALLLGEKQVQRPDGRLIRIAIEANPRDEIEEAWNEASGFLWLMVALAVTVYVLVHVTLGQAFQSVNVILRGLEDIERGDYNKRLEPFRLPEFERIAGAINHMAVTLEAARDENRALHRRSLAIQEEERRHVARELHDELGQSVSAIRLMAVSARNCEDRGRVAETVDSIVAICDRLFSVVRDMMRRLRPLILDELGLTASLEDMIETWRARNPDVQCRFDGDAAVDGRLGDAGIHIYRIVQECLTNISKHSGAGNVGIRLEILGGAADGRIALELRDDGVGFDPAQPRTGFGLLGIRERVAGLGGDFRLVTAPGRGARLYVEVPCSGANPR